MTKGPPLRLRRHGPSVVEVLTAYLNPSEQVKELRATLARLAAPDAPADEADLGQVIDQAIELARDASGTPDVPTALTTLHSRSADDQPVRRGLL